MEELIRITPNKLRVKSILKMVEVTIERIKSTENTKFATLVAKDYYDVIRELASAVLMLDGYKSEGEGAHKKLIEYLAINYQDNFRKSEIGIIEDLRDKRNKISYEGLFLPDDYITQRIKEIESIILKLKLIINKKL